MRNVVNVMSGISLGFYNNNKPVRKERQLWRILQCSCCNSSFFLRLPSRETTWILHYSQPCWGLPGTSVKQLFNIPQWFLLHPEALRINQICPPPDCISFVFVAHLESSCVLAYRSTKPHGANPGPPGGSWEKNNRLIERVIKFKNLLKRLGSDVQVIFFTAQSVSYESRAQRKMNKDLRLARKGAPTGFGHGRRHSCLGYVPKLCILHLYSTHIHERECS